jgi:hypothetical protein
MTDSTQRRAAKMTRVFGRLRFDWMRGRGDFIRPREVPKDVWRSWSEERRCRYVMEHVGVSVP